MPMIKILVVDDEENICEFLSILLKREGYTVETDQDAKLALKKLEVFYPDIVITDIKMPEMDGLTLLSKIKGIKSDTLVILITAYASLESAIEAVKRDAFDYLTKPFKIDDIKIAVKRAVEHINLRKENIRLRQELKKIKFEDEIIGESPIFKDVLELAKKVSGTDSTILISGESGTGKEVIAHLIHKMSPRKDFPFITVSCGALPETILASELFGHLKGSFTGAIRDKQGLFKAADGGTLFLDEIGIASPKIQIGLLRAIEERKITPVGSTTPIKVDVRLITATNIDLEERIKNGEFRKDLFFRLSVIPIKLPPLRKRRDDIPILTYYFLKKHCQRHRMSLKNLSKEAMKLLIDYEWPGNVRELENTVERTVVLSDSQTITSQYLSENIQNLPRRQAGKTLYEGNILADRQRQIVEYLKTHESITTKICSQLFNISERTARNDLRELIDKELLVREGTGKRNAFYSLKET